VVCALAAAPSGGLCAQSRWQERAFPNDKGTEEAISPSRFLVLDTGGSGGGFGKGDVRKQLHDVHFWNRKIGWTCGYRGVFRTEDGGLTWRRVKPPGGWYHVEMTGPREIWLLEGHHPGGWGKVWLWHSTDNGENWHEVLADKLAGYSDLYCRGRQCWVLCGGFPSYRSRDGGETWQRERFGGLLHGTLKIAIPADVATAKGFAIYVVGQFERKVRLVKSGDGGDTWSVVNLPEGGLSWGRAIHFATSQKGWVGGNEGEVLYTEDGGASWQERDLPTDQRVMSLWLDQSGWGFAAVLNNDFLRFRQTLYETRDGGRAWTAVLGGAKHVSRLFALGRGSVWAVGDVPGFVPNDLVAILDRP